MPFRRRRPLLDPDQAYELWAETYPPFAHNELMRVEEEAMKARFPPLAGASVLDLGTGSGRYLCVVAAAGAASVVGVDRSRAMIARARTTGAPLLRADAGALPFLPGAFDLVLASLVVGDLPELGAFAREAGRGLRPGGTLLYSDFHPSWEERGWQRTFESADGRGFRIPFHPHGLDHHRASLRIAGFAKIETSEVLLQDRPVCVVVRGTR